MVAEDERKTQGSPSGNSAKHPGRCSVCGAENVRLYQRKTCKPCLVKEFEGMKQFIDHHRSVIFSGKGSG